VCTFGDRPVESSFREHGQLYRRPSGAVPLRGDWTSIRNYLNANCGTSLAP